MVAPIVGWGRCLRCGADVAHRLNCVPTKFCSETCRVQYRRTIDPARLCRWQQKANARTRKARRLRVVRRFAENALVLRAQS